MDGARTESQVWKIVNRKSKRKRRTVDAIVMEEWDGYFRMLLGGVEWRIRRGLEGEWRRWRGRNKKRRCEGGDKEIKGREGDGGMEFRMKFGNM